MDHEPPSNCSTRKTLQCNYCKKPCDPPLKCKGCNRVYYCSKSCQRSHWKYHKQFCLQSITNGTPGGSDKGGGSLTVTEALKELNTLIGGLSVKETTESYFRATDEVKRLNTVQTNDVGKDNGDGENSEGKEGVSRVNFSSDEMVSQPDKLKSLEHNLSQEHRGEDHANNVDTTSHTNFDVEKKIKIAPNGIKETSCPLSVSMLFSYYSPFPFMIENLMNISTLNFTIILPYDDTFGTHNLFSKIGTRNLFSKLTENSTDITNLKGNGLQLEDIRLHVESISCTAGEMNDKNRHNVALSIKSTSDLVGQLRTNTKLERYKEDYMLASFCLENEIITNEDDAIASLSISDGRFISFRLQYYEQGCPGLEPQDESVLHSIARDMKLTDINALNNVECRFCNNKLQWTPKFGGKEANNYKSEKNSTKDLKERLNDTEIMDSVGIKKVFRLATGNWDEITDYLVCYEGQPALNFSSSATTALKGTVFEEECAIVLHKKDVPNVCVLAIEGYGEDNTYDMNEKIQEENAQRPNSKFVQKLENGAHFRGIRAWKDNVGGATICCTQCCSPLGYASTEHPDTFRLYKHRLRAYVNINETPRTSILIRPNSFAKNTCGSFVGREIVRYAECQAVYTIVVVCQPFANKEIEGLENTGNMHHKNRRCLLLKLLSLNTKIALDRDLAREGYKEGKRHEFRRIVKVIYEETEDMIDPLNHSNSDNPSDWTWGGVDLCCLPEGKVTKFGSPDASDVMGKSRKASARIYLAKDEWTELKDSLSLGATYFSTSISKSTVLLKMGGDYDYKNASLSMLYLP